MGVSMFEREKLERRVEFGSTVGKISAGLLALLLGYGWWTGEFAPLVVLFGFLVLGALGWLSFAASGKEIPTRPLGLILGILAVLAIVESLRRPLRFDILVWIAVILVLRAWLAARRLEASR